MALHNDNSLESPFVPMLLIDNIQVQACPSARARERLLFGTVKHYRQSVCADYVIGLVRIEATEQVICAK